MRSHDTTMPVEHESRIGRYATMDPVEHEARIGRYAVLEEIGRGAMGRVLRAYDPKLQREVALKVMRAQVFGESGAQRLVTEARAMAQLSHPNVVAVYDVEELAHHRVVLAMELVSGQTLSAWLRESHPWSQIVERFVDAGRGLAAAHAAGLLHRDFKPDNVLVADDGTVKVTDFGLAKFDGPDVASVPAELVGDEQDDSSGSPALTETGTVMGTPLYMAPEQHQGRSLAPTADQYAFCVALWTALTQEAPFGGPELAQAKAQGPPPWPGGPAPRRIASAIVRGLSADPVRRWPSMKALLSELDVDPARRRRRWLFTATGLGAVVLPAVGVHTWSTLRADECAPEAATARLEDVWGEPRRTAARHAMLEVDVVYAEDTWTRTETALDEYASAWKRMRVDTCEATTIRGEQSDAVMGLRMACLHRARVDLAAVTEVFTCADAGVVRRAHELVVGLPKLSRCADVEALMADVAPPSPEEAEAVASVRERLAAARATGAAGRYDEARVHIDDAYDLLDDLEYEPVHVDTKLADGSLRAYTGDYERSEELLRTGLIEAAQQGRWETIQDVSIVLVTLVGSRTKQGDEVSPYIDLALGLGKVDAERRAPRPRQHLARPVRTGQVRRSGD